VEDKESEEEPVVKKNPFFILCEGYKGEIKFSRSIRPISGSSVREIELSVTYKLKASKEERKSVVFRLCS
jgi:hypothetical protein